MRCKNCGWPNKPNETTCVKCHTPLVADDDIDVKISQPSVGNDERNIAKTVLEDDVFGAGASAPSDATHYTVQEAEQTQPCPKCGYPLRPGTDKCPNCKFQVRGSQQSHQSQEAPHVNVTSGGNRRPTRMDNGGGVHRGTVNPYMMNMDLEPSFMLKPIKRANERHELEEIEFEGKSVSLNRSNTEENNASITSREQAVITNIDGHWYIEDKSDQKTTFVQAGKRVEISDGDLILLGNRLFEFHE